MESKFNFSEEENIQNLSEKSVSKNAKGFFQSLYIFFKQTLDFRRNTDKESTINSIKEDISIKGANAWILICSIFVASVGLNANSIPVVIGAMLISPLMGPILGFGMSIAINDLETLKRSFINFVVMVSLSVITAYLFFAFFPLREESSELLSRTKPDIRDILIAFFGGLALIIAKTKKGTISSVIFGVAIATALMPPLCTVGYGLATGNNIFSLGAMYLFMINTLYIILATYLVIKLLGFPMINYANSKKRTLIARIVTFFSILMLIPAYITFMGVLNESKFNSSATKFLKTELDGLKNKEYLEDTAIKKYNPNENKESFSWPWNVKESEIVLNMFGLEPISNEAMDLLSAKMVKYPNLSQTKIIFNQKNIENDFKEQKRFLVELRQRDSIDLIEKNIQIQILNKKISDFEKKDKINLLFDDIFNEINIHFEEIEEFYYDKSNSDSIPLFLVKWSNNINEDIIINKEKKLNKWISYKLSNMPFKLIRK